MTTNTTNNEAAAAAVAAPQFSSFDLDLILAVYNYTHSQSRANIMAVVCDNLIGKYRLTPEMMAQSLQHTLHYTTQEGAQTIPGFNDNMRKLLDSLTPTT